MAQVNMQLKGNDDMIRVKVSEYNRLKAALIAGDQTWLRFESPLGVELMIRREEVALLAFASDEVEKKIEAEEFSDEKEPWQQ